jgi:hypothetical protein
VPLLTNAAGLARNGQPKTDLVYMHALVKKVLSAYASVLCLSIPKTYSTPIRLTEKKWESG